LWSLASVCVRVCLSVCLSVRLSAAVRLHYCTDPDVTWGRGRCRPLVVHYWADLQSVHGLRCYGNIHNANPSYKLASIPQYDDIVRTLGGVCARCWRVTGVVLKIARHIWEVGVAGWPVTGLRRGPFSTLLRRPGLRASTGGVLAT